MIKVKRGYSPAASVLRRGIIGGLVSGVVFMLAQIVLTRILGFPAINPLRMAASIVLGTETLSVDFPVFPVLVAATVTLAAFSVVWGVVFVFLLAWGRQLEAHPAMSAGYGAVYGLGVWIVDFLMLGPVVFPQLLYVNQFWHGFVAHTVFLGAALGFVSRSSRPRQYVRKQEVAVVK